VEKSSLHVGKEIWKQVIKIMRELSYQTEEKTGIQTSIEEQDIQQYLNKAITEVKGKRRSS
jgi:hypothetical protein